MQNQADLIVQNRLSPIQLIVTITGAASGCLTVVGAVAALIYGRIDTANKQANQQKTYIEQFVAAVNTIELPLNCSLPSDKQKMNLIVAQEYARRLESDFGNSSYKELLEPLASRYVEERAACDVKTAPISANTDDADWANLPLTLSIAQSSLQLRESLVPAEKNAKWATVVATFPDDPDNETRAWQLVCRWRSEYPQFVDWQFRIKRTVAESNSIVIVVNNNQNQIKAARDAQFFRNDRGTGKYLYAAYAQIDRNWSLIRDFVPPVDPKSNAGAGPVAAEAPRGQGDKKVITCPAPPTEHIAEAADYAVRFKGESAAYRPPSPLP